MKQLRALGVGGTARALLEKLLFELAFPAFERLGLHVLPVHFYSPVPDTRALRRHFDRWYRPRTLTGVDLDEEGELELLRELGEFAPECRRLPSEADMVARGLGEGYGEVEARVLHSMIRRLRPSTVIEVGAGVSTAFTARALEANREQHGVEARIVCIEPRPRRGLRELAARSRVPIEIDARPVQDVELEVFSRLGAQDVLFIDSSHVSKLDSDVDRLYLEVVPALRPGVVVHAHDIPLPYPAPDPERWVFRKHRFWNEAAVVNAFLAFNSAFRVMLCTSWLHREHPRELGSAIGGYDASLHEPTALWFSRVR